jgi:microcystin-dependent protein
MMKRQSFLAAGAGALLAGCAGSAVPSGSAAPANLPNDAKPASSEEGGQLLGSLLLVPYDYVPEQFAACDGQILPVRGNLALFSLLYDKYGGDGTTNFALPNLNGKEPIKNLRYVIAIDGFFPARSRTALKEAAKYGGYAPLLGQLLLVPYLPKFVPPSDWAKCEGQLLNIAENPVLYSVIGTRFGGDGRRTFALPDLREHAPIKGLTYVIALRGRYPSRT